MAGSLGGSFVYNNTGTQGTSGVVPMQGTGRVPQYAQPANNVGGFQTAGFQYGAAPSAGVDTSRVAAAQMPVSSVGQGENYMNNMQDAYWNQATSRLDPMWDQRTSADESRLTNMGLSRGSAAWDREMGSLGRDRNDAYGGALNSAILNSGAEAQRRQGMDIASGNFANNATQQNFQNELTSQGAYNTAAGQEFNQNQAGAQLNNAALTAEQNAGQGWGNIEANRFASSNALAGTMANASVNSQLGNRNYDIQEGQQQFDNSRTMRFDPIIEQNMLAQGMNPQNPEFAGYTPAAYPGGYANYAQQMQQGNNQQYGASGSFGGYLAGQMPTRAAPPDYGNYNDYYQGGGR